MATIRADELTKYQAGSQAAQIVSVEMAVIMTLELRDGTIARVAAPVKEAIERTPSVGSYYVEMADGEWLCVPHDVFLERFHPI